MFLSASSAETERSLVYSCILCKLLRALVRVRVCVCDAL